MNEINQQGNTQQTIYIWLSIALLTPILLLPLRLTYGGGTPAFGVNIELRWLLLASCLLLVAVTADLLLRLINHSSDHASRSLPWSMYASAFWILVVCTAIPYIVVQPSLVWYLAALFLLHACATGFSLWRGDDGWWLWCAWWRDMTCALSLLVWPAYWP